MRLAQMTCIYLWTLAPSQAELAAEDSALRHLSPKSHDVVRWNNSPDQAQTASTCSLEKRLRDSYLTGQLNI